MNIKTDWLSSRIHKISEQNNLIGSKDYNYSQYFTEKDINRINKEAGELIKSNFIIKNDFDIELGNLIKNITIAYNAKDLSTKSKVDFKFGNTILSCDNNLISLYALYLKLAKNKNLFTEPTKTKIKPAKIEIIEAEVIKNPVITKNKEIAIIKPANNLSIQDLLINSPANLLKINKKPRSMHIQQFYLSTELRFLNKIYIYQNDVMHSGLIIPLLKLAIIRKYNNAITILKKLAIELYGKIKDFSFADFGIYSFD